MSKLAEIEALLFCGGRRWTQGSSIGRNPFFAADRGYSEFGEVG